MATTTPPNEPLIDEPTLPPTSRPPRTSTLRFVVAGALLAVLVIVLLLVLGGSGGATYHLIFTNANGVVRGDQVQVGGVPVGQVKEIELLHDYRVRITVHVDSSLVPLHKGTTAEVRVPSLSTVANRYIALSPGPNNALALSAGSTLPTGATRETTDLDQLFDTFTPKTRKGLQQLFQGSAEAVDGVAPQLQLDSRYFPPAINAIDHVLAEFGHDGPLFESFLVESAKATTVLAGRSQQLTELVSHADTALGALGSESENLTSGLRQLPVTLHEGNHLFNELPATLADLRRLIDVSKADTKELPTFFSRLRVLLPQVTPLVSNFSQALSRPGQTNDLTEAALALPGAAKALATSSPDNVRALEESVPITALFGPYSPDLEGFIRAFGSTAGYYDANGHYARSGAVFPDFLQNSEGVLKPAEPSQVVAGLKAGQLRRCPGAATQPASDGSSPFSDNGQLGCDPSQTP
ncbi:MAG TPA: MlaD family protein [Solirubrobacteraceae bacterium]|nr:MlaD family protein [Solirubrobacteraceae bacterium]